MQCPHCSVAIHANWQWHAMKYGSGVNSNWECMTTVCPECHNPSVKIEQQSRMTGILLIDTLMNKEKWVYPSSKRRKIFGDEVPGHLKGDYFEACDVLLLSPRSSATVSRRVLETMLLEQGYDQSKLHLQIEAVLEEKDVNKKLSTNLLRIVDAVRQFGNFSAHQAMDVTGLNIIEVEPEEAEICLEIVEGLFEHYYVRPVIEAKNLKTVNDRLRQAGKKPL